MASTGADVVGSYRDLETMALHMAELARQQDWDGLVQEGEQYVTAVASLADIEHQCPLDANEQVAKRNTLERMLGFDLEIRARLLEYREELTRLIASSRHENNLAHSYGAVAMHGWRGGEPEHP